MKNKHEEEANSAGLTLIGPVTSEHERSQRSVWRKYRFNECGHEQEIAVTAVRKHHFVCQTCEETSLRLPAEVYLLEISSKFTFLKLGYSKNTASRISDYAISWLSIFCTCKNSI